MPSAVPLRTDFSARELRRLAKQSRDSNQSRRLLSLAAVLDGMSRDDAARIGGMDRQTLRDWVHRFNMDGPDALLDAWTNGPTPRLSMEQKSELAVLVEAGPDRQADGVVRWRRIDLKLVIKKRFGAQVSDREICPNAKWRRKQSSANRSPPVGSLFHGENTGKFAHFGLEIAKAPLLSEENSIACQRNSLVPVGN